MAVTDAQFAALTARVTALEARVTKLDGGPVVPPPAGSFSVVSVSAGANPTAGSVVDFTATLSNTTTATIPGVGVGFYLSTGQIAWASAGDLAPGATVTLTTATAPSARWTPAAAGTFTVTAKPGSNGVDRSTGTKSLSVVVKAAPVTPPPTGGGTRLFTAGSLWNTVKSPTTFATGADSRLKSLSYGLNNGDYSHPMIFSKTTDPIHQIVTPNSWGYPAQTLSVNMPDGAVPAGGTDGELCLLLPDGTLVDMWQLHSTGNRTWACSAYAMHNWKTGTGFGEQGTWKAAGITAIGAPTAGGTITAAEIAAGVIPHALCIAFDYNDQGGVGTSGSPSVAPAVGNDVGGGPGPICEGALLFATGAKPAGLNAAESAVWTAASTYGVYVVDKLDGIPMFFGDRSATVGNALSGSGLTAIGRSLRMVKTW